MHGDKIFISADGKVLEVHGRFDLVQRECLRDIHTFYLEAAYVAGTLFEPHRATMGGFDILPRQFDGPLRAPVGDFQVVHGYSRPSDRGVLDEMELRSARRRKQFTQHSAELAMRPRSW